MGRMLLVVNALLIPVAEAAPDVVEDAWMLVGDDGRIVSTGSGTPRRSRARRSTPAARSSLPGS